ncbi:hypothetical protein OKW21_004224 [Catalinimonas alkaloidigena]|uniref:mechanosensitive ion channel family protein n=1 Tax=Catalinimonas alkaloidigena TaxID=1075417 RepID=UPI002406B53E|nr:mechanosensitive ion channel domain-containing protein [Catalinimonas alkaloidigena]MDF9798961.1 hypothetical protein [Catalinimonas alkaloidigena]
METLSEWESIAFSSLHAFGNTLMNALPNILGAVVLLLIGWLIARTMRYITRKLMRTHPMQSISERLHELPWLRSSDVKTEGANVIARFVYWVVLLFFFVAASETLGWSAVSQTIGMLLNYLPALLSAVLIAIIGLYIAQVVKNLLLTALHSLEMHSAHIISSFVFYIIAVFVILTALEQAGIDTSIITSNITLVIGAIMIAFAIAFAMAAKDILQNILSSYYSRQNFQVGNIIKIGEVKGEIIRLDNISVVVKTFSSEVVLPARLLITEKVEKITE